MTVSQLPAVPPALRSPRSPRQLLTTGAATVVVAAVLVQAYTVTETRPGELVSDFTGVFDIVRRGTPPDASVLGEGLSSALVTIDVAIIGTLAAMVISVPLAMCAAENVTPARWIYGVSRALIGVARAVPDIVFALLFVAAVGLGPFPAVLGLGLHSVGILGRLYAEAIEDMDMGPVEALRVAGADRIRVATHAVIPGVVPTLIGVTLYRLDTNVRATLALGFVGGGGLGLQIFNSLELFAYRQLTTYLLVMLGLVLVVEAFAVLLRRRIR